MGSTHQKQDAPEVPKDGVVATGNDDPPLLPPALCDPGELALGKIGTLSHNCIFGFESEQARFGSLAAHPAPEAICFPLILVLHS